MSSSDPNPNTPNPNTRTSPPSGGAAPAKKSSNRSLIFLAGFAVLAAVAAFAVPKILVEIYHAEEEAKARGGNIVGSRIDAELPPGRSRDPYARPGADSAAPEANSPAETKPAETKPTEEKPAEEKPAEDNKPAEDEPTEGTDGGTTEPKSPE